MIRDKVDQMIFEQIDLIDCEITDRDGNSYSGVINVQAHEQSGVDWGEPVRGDMGSGPYYDFEIKHAEVHDLCLLNEADGEECHGPIPMERVGHLVALACLKVEDMHHA